MHPFYVSFIRPRQVYSNSQNHKLDSLTNIALCVFVLVVQKPEKFYIMFSNFYSFAARTVKIFHKYWRKKTVTLIFERTST